MSWRALKASVHVLVDDSPINLLEILPPGHSVFTILDAERITVSNLTVFSASSGRSGFRRLFLRRPGESSFTVTSVFGPCTVPLIFVCPSQHTLTVSLVVPELSVVLHSVYERVLTLSLAHPTLVVALEDVTWRG